MQGIKKDSLKIYIVSLILFGHIMVLVVLIYWWLNGGFDDSEFKTTLSIIAPVLSLQAGTALRHYFKSRHLIEKKSSEIFMSLSHVAISLCIVLAYYTFIVLVICGKALNVSNLDVGDTFVTIIGICQSIMGAFLGTLISDIFEA